METFLFDNNLIDAYWYSSYDFGKRHGHFSRCGGIKANSAAKELNITHVIQKGAHH